MKDRTRDVIVESIPTLLIAGVLFSGLVLYYRTSGSGDELCRHFFSNSGITELASTCYWMQSSAQNVFSFVSIMVVPMLILIASTSFSNRHKLSKLEKEIKKLKGESDV